MNFYNSNREAISYANQKRIAENKARVETTLNCIRTHLPSAIIHNVGTDSLYKQITSVVDLSNKNNWFIDQKYGAQTETQKEMMGNIQLINNCAQNGIKMNFLVDMEGKKYLSACKDENIGVCLCCLYPATASKPIILLADEDQQLGLYAYVGTPSKEGVAYLFAKDQIGSLFVQLREFHFLSLWKDPEGNYDRGHLLSYNYDWGWRNISFSIILKESQDMVRQLFDSVRNSTGSVVQPNSNETNTETKNYPLPWE